MQKAMTFHHAPSNDNDDAKSTIAKRYEDTQKVEDLLKKLEKYIRSGKDDLLDGDKETVLSMP
jgi:hypothetical protein